MKLIFQTIIDKGHGNCMQAAIASLLELQLNEVPHFLEYKDKWFDVFYKFIVNHGCDFDGTLYNYNTWRVINKRRGVPTVKLRSRLYKLKQMKGIKGYFYASVYSPKYYNPDDICPITHAVIIDKYLNIIHDVNPNNRDIVKYPEASKLKFNGILDVFMINEK